MMRRLRTLSRLGTGKIGVLLPDTMTSPRYSEFDAPYLARALQAAGLRRSQFFITNAQGSDATEQAQAESDMTQGATVLLLDPIDSGVGASIESAAASLGVKVIDYDRMTLGGTRAYYVSFDNVAVGALMARGLVNCIRAWHVRRPDVLVMRGAPTDNNATLFARGYDQRAPAVLRLRALHRRGAAARQLGPHDRADHVRGAVHREQQDHGRAHPERRHGQRGHLLPEDAEHPAPHLPHHRPGRHPGRAGQHPGRLPVRHRLQADLPGGAGGRGAHACTCGPGRSRRPAWSTAPPSIRPARSGCRPCCCDRSG